MGQPERLVIAGSLEKPKLTVESREKLAIAMPFKFSVDGDRGDYFLELLREYADKRVSVRCSLIEQLPLFGRTNGSFPVYKLTLEREGVVMDTWDGLELLDADELRFIVGRVWDEIQEDKAARAAEVREAEHQVHQVADATPETPAAELPQLGDRVRPFGLDGDDRKGQLVFIHAGNVCNDLIFALYDVWKNAGEPADPASLDALKAELDHPEDCSGCADVAGCVEPVAIVRLDAAATGEIDGEGAEAQELIYLLSSLTKVYEAEGAGQPDTPAELPEGVWPNIGGRCDTPDGPGVIVTIYGSPATAVEVEFSPPAGEEGLKYRVYDLDQVVPLPDPDESEPPPCEHRATDESMKCLLFSTVPCPRDWRLSDGTCEPPLSDETPADPPWFPQEGEAVTTPHGSAWVLKVDGGDVFVRFTPSEGAAPARYALDQVGRIDHDPDACPGQLCRGECVGIGPVDEQEAEGEAYHEPEEDEPQPGDMAHGDAQPIAQEAEPSQVEELRIPMKHRAGSNTADLPKCFIVLGEVGPYGGPSLGGWRYGLELTCHHEYLTPPPVGGRGFTLKADSPLFYLTREGALFGCLGKAYDLALAARDRDGQTKVMQKEAQRILDSLEAYRAEHLPNTDPFSKLPEF